MSEIQEMPVDTSTRTIPTVGYAAYAASEDLAPFKFDRREPLAHDVLIEILYCGVCHSDLHCVRNDWGISMFPLVPGHEIVGRVTRTGDHVSKFKVGDTVGVGVFVDSCRECESCKEDLEQYCEKGVVLTYSAFEKDGKTVTYGGYSNRSYVMKNMCCGFQTACRWKKSLLYYAPALQPVAAAALESESRDKVAVIGLGGLGHMAVKFAVSFGADVTVLSTSASKEKMPSG
jgi:uncharacterized zinc-type alcohol dehydrogenase-like protein